MNNQGKLTLSIKLAVIKKAKRYAKTERRSLSSIVENYLNSIVSEINEDNQDFDKETEDILSELSGCIQLPDEDKNKSYKELVSEAVYEKYMNND